MSIETIMIDFCGHEIEVTCEFNFYKGRPAKLYAAPEDCYPEEPDEYDIVSVKAGEVDLTPLVTDDMDEVIIDQLQELRV